MYLHHIPPAPNFCPFVLLPQTFLYDKLHFLIAYTFLALKNSRNTSDAVIHVIQSGREKVVNLSLLHCIFRLGAF